jgi:hypothetical protein
VITSVQRWNVSARSLHAHPTRGLLSWKLPQAQMQLCAAKVQATTSRRVLAPCDVALSLSTSASTACTAAFAASSVLLMVSPACSAQQQQLLGGHICPVWVLLVDRGALADVLASIRRRRKKLAHIARSLAFACLTRSVGHGHQEVPVSPAGRSRSVDLLGG